MSDTKEKILLTALRLFASEGYAALPVSRIAAELGLSKGALYRHYHSKRDIFDSIVRRMEQLDLQQALAFDLPTHNDGYPATADAQTALRRLCDYSREQFRRWTQQEFSACFRRLLTLEQYRDAEMAALYQQYLAGGPLDYLSALMRPWAADATHSRQLAMQFYAPMFLLYSLYDGGGAGQQQAEAQLQAHLQQFCAQLSR